MQIIQSKTTIKNGQIILAKYKNISYKKTNV